MSVALGLLGGFLGQETHTKPRPFGLGRANNPVIFLKEIEPTVGSWYLITEQQWSFAN